MWFPIACVFVGIFIQSSAAQDEEACGNRQPKLIAVQSSGVLYSPGFQRDQRYPDNIRCSYQLQVPYGMSLRLKFDELDIDATDSCQADYLAIFDFDAQGHGIMLARLCGDQKPNDYVSKSDAMQLIFRSDEFANRKGFKITYSVSSTSDVCPSNQLTCRNRKCVSNSVACNGNDDCGDGTDEEKCGYVPVSTACGLPEISPKSVANYDRIVGGDAVVPGSWPWMVSMQQKLVEPNGQVCGGSLINSQWVLAAAHCFGDLRHPNDWRIHLGIHKKFEKDPYEQIRYVERIVIWDDIDSSTFEGDGQYDLVHDVALVKLNAPVKFSKFVKPICLPDPGVKLSSSSRCYATGWGVTRGSGHSEVLKQAVHPIQTDDKCVRLVGQQFDSNTMICAGSLQDKNGVCHGDSGGPLACEIGKIWSIFGVASYVTSTNFIDGLCGLEGRPSVFNKIDVKIPWIKKMINKYN